MTRLLRLSIAAAMLVAACEAPKADEEVAAAPANDAQRAAALANALRDAPTKSDSILAANGFTDATFEQLMYRVAADPALSAEYGRLIPP